MALSVEQNPAVGQKKSQFPEPAAASAVELEAWERVGAGDFTCSMEMQFGVHLDEARLQRAVDLMLVAEPMIAAKLRVEDDLAQWEAMDEKPQVLFVTDDAAEFDRMRYRSPRASEGPQMRFSFFKGETGDWIHSKVSHQLTDGAGHIELVSLLAEIYSRLAEDPSYVPAPKEAGVRDFSEVMRHAPRFAKLGIIWDLCKFGYAMLQPKATQHLGLPDGPLLPWSYLIKQIPAERVTALQTYGRARGATINDLFLAAFYRTLMSFRKWDGKSALRILVTVDMRQWYLPGGYAPATSNLSAFELPFLGRRPGASYEETLERVKEEMGKRKRNRPGLATALFAWPRPKRQGLPPSRLEKTRKDWAGTGIPILTNGGRVDGERLLFAGNRPVMARHLALALKSPQLIISIAGYDGAMTMSVAAPDVARTEIDAALDMILANLPV